MSIESRIRILWGALGLLVTLLLLSLAYGATAGEAGPSGPAAVVISDEPAHANIVRSNLVEIAYALHEYLSNYDYRLPPRLSMLYPDYISDPAVFWNPGDGEPCPTTIDNDQPDTINSAQVSFHYSGDLPDAFNYSFHVVQDNSIANNQGKGVYALNITELDVHFFEPTTARPASSATARLRLAQIGTALAHYAVDNAGAYPDKLSRLYPAYISIPTVFWNPGDDWRIAEPPTTVDGDSPDGANSAQMSYFYAGGGRTSTCDPATILLRDNSPANNGGAVINLLTADLAVRTYVQIIPCGSLLGCRSLDRRNLHHISNCIHAYAVVNRDWFPARLSMIHRSWVLDPTVFWSRGDADPCPLEIFYDERNRPNSTQVSYAYFAGRADAHPVSAVLHDNSLSNNGGAGLHVATTDRVVEFFEPSDRSLPSAATARANLQQIGQALHAYAAANAGFYPNKLSSLYPAYVSDPAVFWNPGDKQQVPTGISSDEPNQPESAQVSFNYLGAGYSVGSESGVVLLADNSLANNGGVGINLLTAGLKVDFFAPPPTSCQYPAECSLRTESNLREIYFGLIRYANDHADRFPTQLSMLYPEYLSRPRTFWNPGDANESPLTIDNDINDQPNSALISFEFPAADRKASELGAGEVLVRDNTPANNRGNGTLVLHADGDISFVAVRSVSSVAISGPDTVSEAGTAAFTYTATYDDGTIRDVTTGSYWRTTELPGYFPAPGTYTVVMPVHADTSQTIYVEYMDADWTQHFAQKTITVQNTVRVLTDLAITAGPATVGEGETAAYTCTATYDDGGTQDVTAQAVWSVSSGPGSFSSAGTYAAPATVTADTPATIRASFSHDGVGKEVTKDITILNTKRILTGLSIVSGPNSVAEGGSAAYACRATYDDGTFEDATATAAWSVTVGPGSFSAAGTYHAPATVLADTPATLRASYTKDGVTRQATKNITVLNSVRILASLSISSGPAVVPEGGTGAYACTAVYDDGTTQAVTTSAAWTVTAGPGAFTNPGTYAAPASVTANTAVTLQASYTETGVTKTAAKDITVSNGIRRLSSVTIGSGPATVGEGGSGAYTCTAVYDDGTTQDVTTSATWYLLENVGEFLVPGTYTAPASVLADRPVAIHVIYAEGGLSRQASKSITVLNSVRRPAELAISSSPAEVAEGGGADLVCTVTYDDGGTEDVTDAAVWTVTEGPGAFTAPGTYAAPAMVLADTAVKVTAAYGEGGVSKHATAQFTVRNSVRMLASLAVTSGPATLTAGATGNFVCAATYDDGSTRPVTNAATWSIVSGSGSFAIGGVYTAPASVASALSVTIKAAYAEGGITREASRSLRVDPPPAADADGDGVADPNDACPFTPAGAVVDANGCAASQRDSDGDGVSDDRDACPGTPAGTAVQSNGCPPPDRDFDGIADLLDNCPNNANPGQQDADRDGRGDACDACPGDPAKTSPGACGCGVPETADCGAAAVYTVRIITPSGSSSPGTFAADTWADITAPAAPEGMRFAYWSGDHSGTESIARVFMDADKELIANYEDCPEAPMPPCGAGTTACGLTSLLALALLKRRRSS